MNSNEDRTSDAKSGAIEKRREVFTIGRRNLVLVLSVALLSTCGWLLWRYEHTGTVKLVAGATGRIGLVLGALWLAWPALKRPASWLPPGFAVLGVLVMAILAAQPRLIVVMVPAFGGLLALASVVRALRQ